MTTAVGQRLSDTVSRHRPRPIRRLRRWRWRRAETRNIEGLHGYRMPVQVCPRGCEHRELARRDLLVRTRFWGRAAVQASFAFETTNCPECGSRLVRRCARCKHEIFAPVVDRCQFCGLPQPWATERRAGAERASVRYWKPTEEGEEDGPRANDPAHCLYRAGGEGGSLWVIDGSIASLDVDAVVSNDDVDGRMWAQVARAIKNAAGEGVERLAQEGRPFRLGHAWVTTPGALRQMKGIIHVASMSRRGESTIETVRECLVAALEVAAAERYESIGVAAIGSGPASIDPFEWFRAFAEVTVGHLSEQGSPEAERQPPAIVLALFEPPDFEQELATLRQAVYDAWSELGKPATGAPAWEPPAGRWEQMAERLRRA